jgi:PAS domain S-box-containing protein
MTTPASPPPDEPPFEPTPWLEKHPLAHWLFDLETLRLLWGNAAALERYGYGVEGFVQRSRDDLLAPDELPRARAFMAALPHSLQQQPVWRERTADGRELTADWRGVTVRWQGRRARLITVMDAGPREQMVREQQRSRELLQVAGRMALIGGWSVDLTAGVATWSDEVCALHELPPGTRYPLADAVRFYPGDAARQVQASLQRCIESGEPMDLVLPFVGARGTARWVRVVGEAVRDAAGRVVGVQGAQQDVTSAREATQALAESRTHLAALIAAIPDLWMVYDAELRYREVSDPAHPGLSAPWSQKLGRRVHETVSPQLARQLEQLTDAAHRTGQPQSHHYSLDVAGGRDRWFEARYVAMSEGRTLALIRDVTEARELERRFRDLTEAAPIGIFIANDDGAVSYANPAWCALMQLSGEAALGLGWGQSVHPDDLPAVVEAWRHHAEDAGVFQAEFRLRGRGDTAERIVWAQARHLQGGTGGAALHVGCVVDVTSARELQREREARAVVEEAGRRQAAFLSRVSHELRTPLNAILGFGELLRRELAAVPRQAEFLGHVVQAGRHMLALVDDLLELQRIEQGRHALRLEHLQARALLQSVAQMLAPLAASAGMAVVVEVDETDAAVGLDSDERALRQILLNLAGNALKYGRRGGHLGLHARAERRGDERRCVFTVQDDGPGMDDAQLQRLFTPFERLGQDHGGVTGSGLGLVISRQLAEALGGTLVLRSAPGVGTIAELVLPAQR